MVGSTTRLFIGGLPIVKEISEGDLLKVVGKYSKSVEIIRDSEGYCKGFAYVNVPQPSAATCISSLHNSTFQKGILRVEYAQESFMERLHREWGSAPAAMNFKLDTSAKIGTSTPSKSSNGTTPSKSTPATPKASTPATPKASTPTTPAKQSSNTPQPQPTKESNNVEKSTEKKLSKQEKKIALRAKLRAKEAERKLAVAEKKANNKRKAEEIESNETAALDGNETKETQSNKTPKRAENTEEKKAEETNDEQKDEKKQEQGGGANGDKKQLSARQRKNLRRLNADTPSASLPSSSSVPATPTPTPTPTPARSSSYPVTPSAPASSSVGTSDPSTPSTPSSSSTTFWDSSQVHDWANGVAGDELAEKLKAKGVKGRKLINWKESFANDSNGLRKQITEFLQLPEHLEADADDLSTAILQLK